MDRFTAMQTFLTVVDTGSFSNAARRLNVGQPAVSKTIAQLEERLGVKLLVRSTRGLAPVNQEVWLRPVKPAAWRAAAPHRVCGEMASSVAPWRVNSGRAASSACSSMVQVGSHSPPWK